MNPKSLGVGIVTESSTLPLVSFSFVVIIYTLRAPTLWWSETVRMSLMMERYRSELYNFSGFACPCFGLICVRAIDVKMS